VLQRLTPVLLACPYHCAVEKQALIRAMADSEDDSRCTKADEDLMADLAVLIAHAVVIQRAVRRHLAASARLTSPFKLRQAASLHRPSAERLGGAALQRRHPPFPITEQSQELQVWVTRDSHPTGTPLRGDAGTLSQLEGPYAAHRLLQLYDEKWVRGSLQVRRPSHAA
jgi:hypothetical protein